ncbi:hypothetical protein WJX79_001017 [Trebouxia sp. C0005]
MHQTSGANREGVSSRKRREHALIADPLDGELPEAHPKSAQKLRQTGAVGGVLCLQTSGMPLASSGFQPFCVGASPPNSQENVQKFLVDYEAGQHAVQPGHPFTQHVEDLNTAPMPHELPPLPQHASPTLAQAGDSICNRGDSMTNSYGQDSTLPTDLDLVAAQAAYARVPLHLPESTDHVVDDDDFDLQSALAMSLAQFEVEDTLRTTAESLPVKRQSGGGHVWQNERDPTVIEGQPIRTAEEVQKLQKAPDTDQNDSHDTSGAQPTSPHASCNLKKRDAGLVDALNQLSLEELQLFGLDKPFDESKLTTEIVDRLKALRLEKLAAPSGDHGSTLPESGVCKKEESLMDYWYDSEDAASVYDQERRMTMPTQPILVQISFMVDQLFLPSARLVQRRPHKSRQCRRHSWRVKLRLKVDSQTSNKGHYKHIQGILIVTKYTQHVVPGALLLGLFWQQVAFVGHDAGHNAVTHSSKYDGYIGLVVNACIGIGPSWWKATHNVHHLVVNSLDCDPDIQFMPLLAISPRFFKPVFSRYHNAVLHFDAAASRLIPYQHFTFIPLLMVAKYGLYLQSMKQLMQGRCYINRPWETCTQIVFFAWNGVLLGCVQGWVPRLQLLLISHAAFFVLHLQICLSHFSQPTFEGLPEEDQDWVTTQVSGTMNWSCPVWLDWFHGGLQFQIEHHLFPALPRHNLRKASLLVQPLCRDLGLHYHSPSFFGAIQQTLATLRTSALAARRFNASRSFQAFTDSKAWELITTAG